MAVTQKQIDRQIKGATEWKNKGGIGLLWWFTGVGKTFIAIWIINQMLAKNSNIRIIIIVPSVPLKKQWIERIDMYLLQAEYRNRIEIHTVHYIVENNLNIKGHLCIIDEFHEYYSPERTKWLETNYSNFKYWLCLTATWEDRYNRHKKLEHLFPIMDRITKEEAEKEGYVSKSNEFNIGVELTIEERIMYDEETKNLSNLIPKFGKHGLELANRCLSGGEDKEAKYHDNWTYCNMWAHYNGWSKDLDVSHPDHAHIDDMWNPKKIMGYSKNLMKAIRGRKEILWNAKNKFEICLNLIEKYPDLKTICFSQSTTFATNLYKKINEKFGEICVVYHSKIATEKRIINGKETKFGKDRIKQEAIDKFNGDLARVMSTAAALDRGYDNEKIRMAIITSGTENFNQQKQRQGRAVRKEENYEESVLIINCYCKDTKEEESLRKRQSKDRKNVYEVETIDEINYEPKRKDTFSINNL